MLLDAGAAANVHFVLGKDSIDEAIDILSGGGIPDGVSRFIFLLHKPVGMGRRESWHGGSSLKSMSPQLRLAVYRNRTVWALWLLVLVGVLTIAEPFLIFGSKVLFIPGLLAPEVIVTLIKQGLGSQIHIILAVVLGLSAIMLGIMGMTGKKRAFTAGAVLLGVDLLTLAAKVGIDKPDSQEVVMIAITVAVRLYILRFVIRGIRAIGFSRQLKEEMEEADREYEEQLRRGIRYSVDDDRPDSFDIE